MLFCQISEFVGDRLIFLSTPTLTPRPHVMKKTQHQTPFASFAPFTSTTSTAAYAATLLLALSTGCPTPTQPDAGDPDAGELSQDAGTDNTDAGDTDAGEVPTEPVFDPRSKDADPAYDVVFPQDETIVLNIDMPQTTWDAMIADLSDVIGDSGGGGGGGGGPPDFSQFTEFAACADKQQNEACSFSIGENLFEGACAVLDPRIEGFFCATQLETFAAFFESCVGVPEGTACSIDLFGVQGTCQNVNNPVGLGCIDDGGVGGGDDYAAAAFWPRDPVYFETTLRFTAQPKGALEPQEETWQHVGIRFKGNNSLANSARGDNEKLPMRIKMDEFENQYADAEDQRFWGFQHLSLQNNITDPTLLRQKIMAEVFEDAGLPSPRTVFVQVNLNRSGILDDNGAPVGGVQTTNLGLYTLVEVPDNPLLDRVYGNNDGNLYKPDGRGATFNTFVEASMHPKQGDGTFRDVQSLVNAVNTREDSESWRTYIEEIFDIRGFAKLLAYNNASQNWDTYGGLAHNFYMYGDESKAGQLSFIPWDFDLAFSDGSVDLTLESYGNDWPLITVVREDPVYRALYIQYLDEAGQYLQSQELSARFDVLTAQVNVIADAAGNDDRRERSRSQNELIRLFSSLGRNAQDTAAQLRAE